MAREEDQSIKDRLSRQGEEALGKIAEELISNPVVNGALTRAFEAREKAVQAQEAAMGALNIPSAADVERITRRLRSVSQRLEGVEDALDRIEERMAAVSREAGSEEAVAERLEEIGRDLAALREAVAPGGEVPPRAQERLTVTDS
jgi:chromosome segregation ATPase